MTVNSILLDTHVTWWLGYEPEKLSRASIQAIRAASAGKEGIALSAATVYELIWLLQRRRLTAQHPPANFLDEIRHRFAILPIDGTIAERAALLPDPFHGDPMDRIIVTTALTTGRTLITADQAILSSKICLTCW